MAINIEIKWVNTKMVTYFVVIAVFGMLNGINL